MRWTFFQISRKICDHHVQMHVSIFDHMLKNNNSSFVFVINVEWGGGEEVPTPVR